jgi:prepilin-type processing-associated H-X9-DG protein
MTPTIVCPDWCRVSQADHINQLPEAEGSVIHYSTAHSTNGEEGHTFEVFLTRSAYTDGTPDGLDGWPANMLYVDGHAMTREQATEHARAILRLAAEVSDRA